MNYPTGSGNTKYPTSAKTLPEMFNTQLKLYTDKPLVSYKVNGQYVDLSYNEVNHKIRSTAKFLLESGIKKNDAVCVFSENRYEWWIADMAALYIGAVSVPIYSTNSSEEAEYILKDCGARACFVGSEVHLEKVLKILKKLPKLKTLVIFNEPSKKTKDVLSLNEVIEAGAKSKKEKEIDKRCEAIVPDDLVTIMYTSGTTGNPKGVMLTHKNVLCNIKQSVAMFEPWVHTEAVFMSFLPLSHALARTLNYYLPIYGGTKVSFVESILNTLIQDFVLARPTIIVSVPRIFEKIHTNVRAKVANGMFIKKAIFSWAMKVAVKNLKYNCQNLERTGFFKFQFNLANKIIFTKLLKTIGFDNLDFIISGGGPLSVADAEFFVGMGVNLFEGYGLTETTPVVTCNPMGLKKLGSVGVPLQNTIVKISDEGEVLIKGPQVMKGYYKQPAETKEMFDKKGFLKTGDLGRIDEDGYLWLTGRIKEIIITAGGKNISPQNIESALIVSKYIEQCAVIGDGRKYLSLLIVPPFAELEKWASKNGIIFRTRSELLNNPGVLKLYKKEIQELLTRFSQVEQIKKFKLMPIEWSQETGELTPTLKVKRKVIAEKYHKEIEGMYADDKLDGKFIGD